MRRPAIASKAKTTGMKCAGGSAGDPLQTLVLLMMITITKDLQIERFAEGQHHVPLGIAAQQSRVAVKH